MGFTYAVMGLGRQGLAAVYDLLANCEADCVLGFDPDPAQQDLAVDRIAALKPGKGVFEAADSSEMDWAALAQRADVLLSCAPYRFNEAITRECVKVGLAMCDLGGNPDVVSAQQRIAQGSVVPVVPECGLSPGISNVAAVHLAREHAADGVWVRCGGLPAEPPDPEENPLQYKLVFDPQGLISEYSGTCPVIAEGKVLSVPACSFADDFDALHECFPTSNNAPQVAEYLLECGVREYDYMTIRYRGHWAAVQGWKSLGFLSGNAERDRRLAELLAECESLRYDRERDRDRVLMTVTGARRNRGIVRTWEYTIDVEADEATGFTAMELTTSWGGTVVAHHMASERGRPEGFATPERFVDTFWFLEEIDRRLSAVKSGSDLEAAPS